jgi:hypothetical protein
MTVQEFANRLDNRQYGSEISDLEVQMAREHGFIIAFGASDDLLELRGALATTSEDEVGAWDGTTVYVGDDGSVYDTDQIGDREAERFKIIKKTSYLCALEAIWCPNEPDGASWLIKPSVSHSTFQILEDGEVYCVGAVFALSEITGHLSL